MTKKRGNETTHKSSDLSLYLPPIVSVGIAFPAFNVSVVSFFPLRHSSIGEEFTTKITKHTKKEMSAAQ